jgi:type III pantothenate kinase
MTILLIDSGNSRVKVAWTDTRGEAALRDAAAFDQEDLAGLADWLDGLPQAPGHALGANVAGAGPAGAIDALLAPRHCALEWVRPRAQALGMVSSYRNPAALGADRWASLLGVRARLLAQAGPAADTAAARGADESAGEGAARAAPPPFLLATFGTATTLDTVSADGVFVGGLILPGPDMMRNALAIGTADLPLAAGTSEDFPIDTQQAIASGIAAAQAGALLRQWLAALRRHGPALRLYVSGGGWPDVATEAERLFARAAEDTRRLPPTLHVIQNPVLEGLARLAASDPASPIGQPRNP